MQNTRAYNNNNNIPILLLPGEKSGKVFRISNSIKRGELAIKRPARRGSFGKILLNNPYRAGRLIANHLFLCCSFVISCLREFHLFSQVINNLFD